MDWIERWFGFAPDNGDGSLEWAISIAAFMIFLGLGVWTARRRRAARKSRSCDAATRRSSQQSGQG